MKRTLLFILPMVFLMAIGCNDKATESQPTTEEAAVVAEPAAGQKEIYQLKVYTFDNAEQSAITDGFLEKAYLPALKSLGIQNIGVFKQRLSETDTINKTYVLIPLASLDQLAELEDQVFANEAFNTNGSEYLNAAHDNPNFTHIESIIMKAFPDMLQMRPTPLDGPRADRVYELRSYESASEKLYRNKVDMFNAGGEVKLFDDLGFNAVFYAEVISGSRMPNLMYMTTFSDQASRDEHWDAFRSSPVWEELKNRPNYQNNVSHADLIFLYPTEYSDY